MKIYGEFTAGLLGYGPDVFGMLDNFFNGKLISEWDEIYNNDIAPVIFELIVSTINFQAMSKGGIAAKFTPARSYNGGEQQIGIYINGTTNLKRNELDLNVMLASNSVAIVSLNNLTLFTIEEIQIKYSTQHYNGTIYSGYSGGKLFSGISLFIPENSDEKRNPRKEDIFLVNKLIEHLNSNLEYYNKILWYRLDPDRRYMLLDGFNIELYNDFGVKIPAARSLASVVKNQLITVAGNSLVFPVAAGYKVSSSFITEESPNGNQENVTLFDHYKPLTPVEPYRISVPSRGVFAETLQSYCNACEKIEADRLQDWNKFPNTDEPTPFAPITVPTPTVTDWKAVFKDFAPPIVNIQNAPGLPAPGTGLAGLSDLLGKSGAFKDITGLDATQQTALKTYLSNQDNAKAFAEMAKELAMQDHNTQHSDKIMDSLKSAKDSGIINQEEQNKLGKQHLQQIVDGGASQNKQDAVESKKTETSPIKSVSDIGKRGGSAEGTESDSNGNLKSLKVGPNAGRLAFAIDEETAGEGLVNPFPAVIDDPFVRNENFQAALDKAVGELEAKKKLAEGALSIPFTFAEITTDNSPFPSANYRENEVHYIASEAKVAVMYAAYVLRDMVRRFAKLNGITKADELFAQLSLKMDSSILRSVAVIESDPNLTDLNRLPNYAAVFSATQGTVNLNVNFSAAYNTALENMIVPSDNNAAATCIHGLGYSYLNGALAAGGFFDANSSEGLWVAGDFKEGKVWPYVRIQSVNDGLSAQAGTTSHMARLVSLIATKQLLDPLSCEEMLGRLHRSVRVDPPWAGRPLILKKGCITHNKLGLGPLKSNKEVRSEVSVIDSPLTAGRKYVVAWQNLVSLNPVGFADIATLIKNTIKEFEKP